MAPLEVQVKDLPAPAGKGRDGSPTVLVDVKGEALVDLEPMVATLQSVADRHPAKVILDLHDLSFISSLAMGVMLAFRRGILANGGKLKVAAMQKLVLDSFKRARLDKVFEIVETLEAAVK